MKIAVLGCGWLGFPLAKRLVEKGYSVKGSVTRKNKIPVLAAAGIDAHQINLSARDVVGVQTFLKDVKVLIITVPPKYKSADFNLHSEIEWLLKLVVLQKVSRVLYTSSISVYNNLPHFPVYTEEDVPVAPVGKAADLLQVEDLFLKEENFRISILRLGGLLGEDRHPIKHLTGRTQVPNPAAPVNLVHLQDCIEVILALIKHDWFKGVLNVVYPGHPPKQDYYIAAARRMNLPAPHFSNSPSIGRKVSSEKLQRVIGYSFRSGI